MKEIVEVDWNVTGLWKLWAHSALRRGTLFVWRDECKLRSYRDLCPPVCLPAANQPLRAELEVLLPPVGMGQLRHSVRGRTAAHQENLLGSF